MESLATVAVHGRHFSDQLPLLRAWVRAEAAAVLAAADDFGLLSTFPAALAARAEVVSLRCLVIRWSPLARRESPATSKSDTFPKWAQDHCSQFGIINLTLRVG